VIKSHRTGAGLSDGDSERPASVPGSGAPKAGLSGRRAIESAIKRMLMQTQEQRLVTRWRDERGGTRNAEGVERGPSQRSVICAVTPRNWEEAWPEGSGSESFLAHFSQSHTRSSG
jgi:poly-gamma-glutamate capsule biosynthesis protein CapA/YwtB (metallophosphatase superfamily)